MVEATERAASLQDLEDQTDLEEHASFDPYAVLDVDPPHLENIHIDQAYIDNLPPVIDVAKIAKCSTETTQKHLLALRHAYRVLKFMSPRHGSSDTNGVPNKVQL